MDTNSKFAERNTNELDGRICQKSDVAGQILDADCRHGDGVFALFSLPCKLPGLFTVRFTAPADFTPGDAFTLKGREFAVRTRTMEEPEGKLFAADAVVHCDVDMDRDTVFLTAEKTDDHTHPADETRVPVERIISTVAPLTGGGDLSADRTLAILPATAATETDAGESGSVVYAADDDRTSRDKAVTPAMLSSLIAQTPNAGAMKMEVISTSGTGTINAVPGLVFVYVIAGGGGGGNRYSGWSGGGGGAGGCTSAAFSTKGAFTYNTTIGAGGPANSPNSRGGQTFIGISAYRNLVSGLGGYGGGNASNGAHGKGGAGGAGGNPGFNGDDPNGYGQGGTPRISPYETFGYGGHGAYYQGEDAQPGNPGCVIFFYQ